MENRLYNTFLLYFPMYEDRIHQYYKSDRNELTVILEDGSELVFNGFTNSISHLYNHFRDKDRVNTEEYWRRYFSNVLKRKMRNRMITQEDLSERTGISKVSISRYLNRNATPTAFTLHKIAKALDCPITDFVFEYRGITDEDI